MKHTVIVEVSACDFSRVDLAEMAGTEYSSVGEIYEAFGDGACLCGLMTHMDNLNDNCCSADSFFTYVYLNHPAANEYGIDFCNERR